MPLTRDSFESQPLNCYNPSPNFTNSMPGDSNGKFAITCDLPERSGYQVIAAEWDVGDTGASFFNVIDVDFTTEHPAGTVLAPGGNSEDDGGSTGLPEWNSNETYTGGQQVVYNGKVYEAKWWSKGTAPDQASSWEFIRDSDGPTPTPTPTPSPTDRYPIDMNTFIIESDSVREGDKAILQVTKDGVVKEYDLVTVTRGMTRNDLITEMTTKINQISSQELNNSIIAGVKDNYGNVVPNEERVSIYQVASKPYADISFQYRHGDNHLKNELHLMDFKDKYDLNSNGSVNITARIMSHSSNKVNVHVVLQDSSGKAVYENKDIELSPMETYSLSLNADNLQPGDYDLIVASILDGADIWQKDMKIKLLGTSTDIKEYVAGTKYKAGDKVLASGKIYECKGWPYTDWCAVSAYRPDGIYGQEAWTKL